MNVQNEYKEYLSIPQMAEQTSMSQAFWRKAVFRRQISVVKVGRRVLVRRIDLQNFMESHRVPAYTAVGPTGGKRTRGGQCLSAGLKAQGTAICNSSLSSPRRATP
jgi:excisionase family DNA binding protein